MTYLADSSSRLARGSRAGRAMGAFESTSDPTAKLIAEVNRFGPDAPETFRYVPTPFPLATGNVPAAVAVAAAWIFHRRAQDAVLKYGDKGSTELLQRASTIAANPTVLVPQNIDEITKTIAAFADANGLPASKLTIAGKVADLAKSPLAIAAVAGGLLLFFVTRRKTRR